MTRPHMPPTSGSAAGVRPVRAYLRSRGHAPVSLTDRYVTMVQLAVLAAVAGQPVATMIGDLAGPADPARTGAGVALVALAMTAFLVAARAAGPVLLPAPDAAWLLLSPLNRGHVLGRTARALLVVAVVAGLVLGLGVLAVLGAPDQLMWRLLAALALGVSATVGGMALAVLGQASQSWQVWLTVAIAGLVVLAVVAMSGHLRSAMAVAAAAPLSVVATVAAGGVVLSALLARQAWAALGRIPARTLVSASTRAGHVSNAATTLDPGALTWIAEDNHWRARKLASRRWPSMPAPFALAWHDWLRLARRPRRLAAMAAAAALPAVLAQAGLAPTALWAAVLAGGLAAACTGVSGARRDNDNPVMARLMGVARRPALAARAVLPMVLSGSWTILALAGLALAGGSGTQAAALAGPAAGGVWWLLGPLAAPALAAGALRMARRSPVDHSMPVLDTPGGAIPTGPLIWAVTGADLALAGCLPALSAPLVPPGAFGAVLAAQGVAGVLVLLGYVLRAGRAG
ncbi:hypothetical protein E1267_41560 [Nonomuraea longispora]|uniref:Uncharacterized protein n=1 Tax=Nonomuraea longispora TaxID=1848320 RepID=A0A4R4MIZ1_9ACTN|nr:DUF6297 family protein [Nonomuraea longispora]TDB95754.1 hypothetical protein E1267_41560 [Nonomuraea longispora]